MGARECEGEGVCVCVWVAFLHSGVRVAGFFLILF